jgi:hypothetical protein
MDGQLSSLFPPPLKELCFSLCEMHQKLNVTFRTLDGSEQKASQCHLLLPIWCASWATRGLPTAQPGFSPRSDDDVFLVDRVAWRVHFLEVFEFPVPVLIQSAALCLLIMLSSLCSLNIYGERRLIGFLFCMVCKSLQFPSFYFLVLSSIMTAFFLPQFFFSFLGVAKGVREVCVALRMDRHFEKQIFRHLIRLESPVSTSSLLRDFMLIMWSVEPQINNPVDIMMRNIPRTVHFHVPHSCG